MEVRSINLEDVLKWDAYVRSHPMGNVYHLAGWRNVITKTYGHDSFYLAAFETAENGSPPKIHGVLPLFRLKSLLFGNQLVSIPYFDFGGVLADSEEVEKGLIAAAMQIAGEMHSKCVELRQMNVLPCLASGDTTFGTDGKRWTCRDHSKKVRMLRQLANSPEELLQSFKSKLRSQIKRPQKAGLTAQVGGEELIEDFYSVFCVNMRDLGSPVHSRSMMENVLMEFRTTSRIAVVYLGRKPVACSLFMGFRNTLYNPWASSLSEHSNLSPNMLLYWTMLEYACRNGYAVFDFGRSSPGSGTYRFKGQWTAMPLPLHWYCFHPESKQNAESSSEVSRFGMAVRIWQKLPVGLSRLAGPHIRKHIPL